jgi:hypothetical protein
LRTTDTSPFQGNEGLKVPGENAILWDGRREGKKRPEKSAPSEKVAHLPWNTLRCDQHTAVSKTGFLDRDIDCPGIHIKRQFDFLHVTDAGIDEPAPAIHFDFCARRQL